MSSQSAEACEEFVQAFKCWISDNTQSEADEQGHSKAITLVDRSGATANYAVPNDPQLVGRLLSYLDALRKNSTIEDFTLEATSMDEVFVTVGNRFEMANGGVRIPGNRHSETVATADEKKARTGIVTSGDSVADSSAQLSDLSMASDDPDDVERNGAAAQLGALTPEQVQRVLSPPRTTPRIGRAMWFKMANNDQLGAAGWLVFVAIPLILLLISMLVADQLIPWFNRKADSVLTKYLGQMDDLCSSCKLMRVLGFTLPDCDGFTAWGFQNLCEMVEVQRGAEFQAPATWYGTTAQQWPESGNLFARQETSTSVLLFDSKKRLGGDFADPVMARGEKGERVVE